MQRLDLSLSAPAEQLAADEALLDWCEAGHGGETLVFWEPRETFVVVGYGNKVSAEVNLTTCERQGVPIFRRCSGGGTVVQMPGGLNYSLILPLTADGPTRNISTANQFIMERNCGAVQAALGSPHPVISVRGHTDLAVAVPDISRIAVPPGGVPEPTRLLKVAGNSQRRRKHFLLFHGTLLLNCDLRLIGNLLLMPSMEPDYRASRPHGEFVTNLGLPAAAVKAAFAQAWKAEAEWKDPPLAEIAKLAREKYTTHAWNYKF